MTKYKVTTIETELWERSYLIEADSREEAEKKMIAGDWEDSLDGDEVNGTINVTDIEVVEK